MKIIITVNTYYPLKDGVQFVTQYHAENLAQKGHDVTVITTNPGTNKNEVYNGVKIFRFNIKCVHTVYSGEKREYLDFLLKEIKNADALINVCTQNPLTDWCFPILDKIKCKKVLYMHGMYDTRLNLKAMYGLADYGHKIWNDIRWGIYYAINGKTFRKYDDVIQLHDRDYGYVFFKKKYKIDCKVIENAVDSKFFELKNNKQRYAISVANYIPRKNQELILNSFYKIDANDFGLVLIGVQDNDYYNKLLKLQEKLEKEFGKKDVRILFNIDRNETIDLIKNASIYVLGSKWEAFPISIIESMAASIPFISTNVGIVRYLPGGVIVDNEEEMCYWLKTLSSDSNLREQFGKLGNYYACEHMMIDKKVDQLERVLERK